MSPAAKALRGPKNRAVTASRFREARQTCSLTVAEAAKLFRVTERTVQNWESGRVRVPYAAFKLMRILRGHELPHPAWRGFRVVGDTLWTPEGHPFRPDHMAWWSLTCRMADEFRAQARRRAACTGSRSALVSGGSSADPVNLPEPAPTPPAHGGVSEPPKPSRLILTPPPAGVSPCASASGLTPSSNHGVKFSWNVVPVKRVSAGVAPVVVGGEA